MLAVRGRDDAERRVERGGDRADRAVRGDDDGRWVAGVGQDEAAVGGVEERVDAGHDLLVGQLEDQLVEVGEHLGRLEVEGGEGPDRGTELAHRGRSPHPSAHHVADDQGRPPAAHADDVVPVAAHVDPRGARDVAVAHLERGDVGQLVGQQLALQDQGGLALAPVEPRVVEPRGGLCGDAGRQPFGAVVEAAGLGVSQQQHALDPAVLADDGDGEVAAEREVAVGQSREQRVELVPRVLENVVGADDLRPEERRVRAGGGPRDGERVEQRLVDARENEERGRLVVAVAGVGEERAELCAGDLDGGVGGELDERLELELGAQQPGHPVQGLDDLGLAAQPHVLPAQLADGVLEPPGLVGGGPLVDLQQLLERAESRHRHLDAVDHAQLLAVEQWRIGELEHGQLGADGDDAEKVGGVATDRYATEEHDGEDLAGGQLGAVADHGGDVVVVDEALVGDPAAGLGPLDQEDPEVLLRVQVAGHDGVEVQPELADEGGDHRRPADGLRRRQRDGPVGSRQPPVLPLRQVAVAAEQGQAAQLGVGFGVHRLAGHLAQVARQVGEALGAEHAGEHQLGRAGGRVGEELAQAANRRGCRSLHRAGPCAGDPHARRTRDGVDQPQVREVTHKPACHRGQPGTCRQWKA